MASRLEQAKALYQEDLEAVDALIRARASDKVPLITEVVEHILGSGGKRLRPVLTLLSARMCGYAPKEEARPGRHVCMAAAVELLHTATLLHDDVVDESLLRRGVDTANAVWGNAPSVLVGDFLLSQAFQLMAQEESREVIQILSDASAVITEGEIRQLSLLHHVEMEMEDYLEVIQGKTAHLFAACCRIGAVLGGCDAKEKDALAAFGLHLGTAFQMIDDGLDYAANPRRLGKNIGDDFREAKVTLPVILAYRQGDATERAFWHRVMHDTQQAEDLDQAIAYLKESGILEQVQDHAKRFVAQATEALESFPENAYREALAELLHFSVARQA